MSKEASKYSLFVQVRINESNLCKRQKFPESTKLFEPQIIYLGGSIMKDNKYLEEFKIDLVKQYLQGKQKKDICKEYGVAKSTMWGWICKYTNLIEKSWEVKGIETFEDEYVDITMPLKDEYKDRTIINTTNETVRVFKNGYSILCHISKLEKVMRIINDD